MRHAIGKSFVGKRDDVDEIQGISSIGDSLVAWCSLCHIGEALVQFLFVFPAKCDHAEIMLLPEAEGQMFESRFVVENVSHLPVNR